MPHPTQRTNEIHIKKLKGLNNLSLDFNPHPLTAIMGVNGCGKTTILHALACCYQPYTSQGSRNYKFSMFFTPNTDSRWSGSEFDLIYSHELTPGQTLRRYAKSSDRWSPKYSTRLSRYVSYLGIRGAVPEIEEQTNYSFIALTKSPRNDAISNRIREAARYVLNRNYTHLTNNSRGGKMLVGVKYKGIDYSAISMGSGEQRVFKILESAYRAPEYGLILIDEIELLLHTDALKRLIIKLHEIASNSNLQIIFTTHAESVLLQKDKVNIRHVFVAEDNNAYCINNANPKLLYELSGVESRPLKVFIEDELSAQIVVRISKELGIRKHVETAIYGPAINCFTAVGGAILNGSDISNAIFVLDGDLYRTEAEKRAQIARILTGTDAASRTRRGDALQAIIQFALPEEKAPEQYFHESIVSLTTLANHEEEEIRLAAIQIEAVNDTHHYIDDILARLGAEGQYSEIVNLLAKQPWWGGYTASLRDWLRGRKAALDL
ncbi:MAG TPA: AAA family ATPase [Chryseolinea sp.]